eukprot:CAMPEP_0113947904 /NCGR_PEP_ID=MMETSP1339-20121228/67373_1 /TAXON_ID=94617 /ORGANISM="Fibrocapsa japonica" /LENGTH=156 /DNA_ID=CAMNT_0000954717 /DNA_START=6 /DNA_END=476 /DNA_ORIENTATION=+ /assembly_acc=CAM_ASM_000762
MAPGTRFRRLIPETDSAIADNGEKVKKLILCSGKIYYELYQARVDMGIDDIAIARVEQIAPFPFDHVAELTKQYPNAEICWVQEEPKNMGAWTYVHPRIMTATRAADNGLRKEKRPHYIGRGPAASPATGMSRVHVIEQKAIIDEAMSREKFDEVF